MRTDELRLTRRDIEAERVVTLIPDPVLAARRLRANPADQNAVDDAITALFMLADKHARAMAVLKDAEFI